MWFNIEILSSWMHWFWLLLCKKEFNLLCLRAATTTSSPNKPQLILLYAADEWYLCLYIVYYQQFVPIKLNLTVAQFVLANDVQRAYSSGEPVNTFGAYSCVFVYVCECGCDCDCIYIYTFEATSCWFRDMTKNGYFEYRLFRIQAYIYTI